MKTFGIIAAHSLADMACYSPDIDRGLNASLKAEEEAQKAGGTRAAGFDTSDLQGRKTTLAGSLAAAGIGTVAEAAGLGRSGKVTLVHKLGHEGVVAIDAFSGAILPHDDNADWAAEQGLVMATLGERHIYYSQKAGDLYTADLRMPDAIAFEDLSWLAINPETGDEQVIEADAEFRLDVLAGIIGGIDREAEHNDEAVAGISGGVELAADQGRTGEEMAAFTEAGGKIFATEEQRQQARTGTGG